MKFKKLNFQPLPLMASSHLQMIVTTFLSPGDPPPSKQWRVELGGGDALMCEVSTPVQWKEPDATVVLVHGMGGSDSSSYMIRMARKLFHKGIKAVRVNLRGCGSGKGMSKLLYHAGTSHDVLKVIHGLKRESPHSDIILIGYSLGGNIALKLAGELKSAAKELVKTVIAVCPPTDLAQSATRIQEKRNRFYHLYYLKSVRDQSNAGGHYKIRTLYEFDNLITAPPWGYKSADEYYHDCSSIRFLPSIEQSTHILLAKDDPFILFNRLQGMSLPEPINIWATDRGAHLGFLGETSKAHSPYWMDELLMNWIAGDFTSNLHSSHR